MWDLSLRSLSWLKGELTNSSGLRSQVSGLRSQVSGLRHNQTNEREVNTLTIPTVSEVHADPALTSGHKAGRAVPGASR